jgi:hypothetical protein
VNWPSQPSVSSSEEKEKKKVGVARSVRNQVRRAIITLRKGKAISHHKVLFPFCNVFVDRLAQLPCLNLTELTLKGSMFDASSVIRLLTMCPHLWRLCTDTSPTITVQVCIDVLQWRIGLIAKQDEEKKDSTQQFASLLWEIEETAAALLPDWWTNDRKRQLLLLAKQARVKFIAQ